MGRHLAAGREQELAEAWLKAPDRNAVTQAAHLIDQLLQHNPEHFGQPYSINRRSLMVLPLGVLYRVLKDVQRIEVLHVWHVPPLNGQQLKS